MALLALLITFGLHLAAIRVDFLIVVRVDFLIVVKFLPPSNKQLRTHGKKFQELAQTLIVKSGDKYNMPPFFLIVCFSTRLVASSGIIIIFLFF